MSKITVVIDEDGVVEEMCSRACTSHEQDTVLDSLKANNLGGLKFKADDILATDHRKGIYIEVRGVASGNLLLINNKGELELKRHVNSELGLSLGNGGKINLIGEE